MTLPTGIIKTSYPDRDVYNLGTLFDGATPFHVGPYQAGNTAVPFHSWNARVIDRKVPLSVKRSPAQIIAARRMFPFGDTGCKVGAVPNYTFAGPGDNAGITKYEPTTGERSDIGLVTDPSAYFMLTGIPGPMLAWAQAASSVPFFFRDERTGKPVDLMQYPQAEAYDARGLQGEPFFPKGPPNEAGYPAYGDGWRPQQAHLCEMSYLAHVATGDDTFLEDLQYEANFVLIDDGAKSKPTGAIISGELRGLAWGFRQLFMAHVATQDAEAAGTLPPKCHPSSYFKTLLGNALAFYGPIMKEPAAQTFRVVGGGDRFGPWQCDYMLSALAFGVLTGHSDWAPLYLWALGNAIARTNGTSGYPVGWGGAYYLNACEWGKDAQGNYDQGVYDHSKPLDWYGSFLFQVNDPNGKQPTPAEIATLKADQFNGGRPMTGAEYLMTTRAVIVMAQYLHKLGLVDVKAVYPELDTCFTNVDRMVRYGGTMNPRVSVVLDASSAPVTLPPLPDPVPDPVPTPPPAVFPMTVHGLLQRAQAILALIP